jgi:hypothetical protein
MIIGLTGLAGSGKDTVAALLAMRGFARYAFADALRKEVIHALADPGQIEAIAQTHPDLAAMLRAVTVNEVFAKPTPPAMRGLLQFWGTEYRRSQDPNYWVSKLMAQIDTDQAGHIPKQQYCGAPEFSAAISDVRFPNEAEAIRERSGKIWRIVGRGGDAGTAHASESGQSEIRADEHLMNDGTVYDLALKVAKLTESST